MQNNIKNQKLIFLSLLLLVLFSYPLIAIANHPVFVAGIPILFVYVLVVWIIAIYFLYRLADRKSKKTDE